MTGEVGTCPYCGAPVGDDCLPLAVAGGCWEGGQFAEAMRRRGRSEEEITAQLSQGADPSCYERHYVWSFNQRARRTRRIWWSVLAAAAVLAVLVVVVAHLH